MFRILVLIFFACTSLLATPLEETLKQNHPCFHVEETGVERHEEAKTYSLKLDSLAWQGKAWTHTLKITVPGEIRSPYALVRVFGYHNEATKAFAIEAQKTGSIIAQIDAVPNQPLKFEDEEKSLKEDALVAYSWKKFMMTGDVNWPLHLPMAKAIAAAIDVTQSVAKTNAGIDLKGVVLMGESKRAWASWLVAACDPRVVGLIPIVCDFLNVKETFLHHYHSFGGWSIAIGDYVRAGFDEKCIGNQVFDELLKIEDPYSYLANYTMPKYIINSAGDPFSPPDSSQFYFSKLPEKKYLRYIPNIGHNLTASDYLASALLFYEAIVYHKPLPELSWSRKGDTLHVISHTCPLKVTLWHITNEKARDFRFDFTDRRWRPQPLEVQQSGEYDIALIKPEKGWSADFVEFEFEGGYLFTTEVYVTSKTTAI